MIIHWLPWDKPNNTMLALLEAATAGRQPQRDAHEAVLVVRWWVYSLTIGGCWLTSWIFKTGIAASPPSMFPHEYDKPLIFGKIILSRLFPESGLWAQLRLAQHLEWQHGSWLFQRHCLPLSAISVRQTLHGRSTRKTGGFNQQKWIDIVMYCTPQELIKIAILKGKWWHTIGFVHFWQAHFEGETMWDSWFQCAEKQSFTQPRRVSS